MSAAIVCLDEIWAPDMIVILDQLIEYSDHIQPLFSTPKNVILMCHKFIETPKNEKFIM